MRSSIRLKLIQSWANSPDTVRDWRSVNRIILRSRLSQIVLPHKAIQVETIVSSESFVAADIKTNALRIELAVNQRRLCKQVNHMPSVPVMSLARQSRLNSAAPRQPIDDDPS